MRYPVNTPLVDTFDQILNTLAYDQVGSWYLTENGNHHIEQNLDENSQLISVTILIK